MESLNSVSFCLENLAQGPPKTTQEPPQEPSWNGLGAILGPTDYKIENKIDFCQTPFGFGVDFGSQNGPQNDPKTTPKRVKNQDEKCLLFYRSWTRLRPVLRRSWADLKAHLGSKVWSPPRRNCIS